MSKNIGIACSIIFIVSVFLPYISIGKIDGTLLKYATETENTDWIGVLLLGIGSVLLILGSEKKIALVLTIIGGLFPLYRFYKLVTVDIGSSVFAQALKPSFAIGGYLILLAVFIQVYACLQSESDSGEKNSNWNRDPITIDDIVTPLKLFILLIGIPSSIFILFAFTIPILSTVSPSVSTDTVDICDCLTNASYYNNNENDCDKAINKELGYNWKTTNYSQEPSKSAKFDALAERCN